MYSFVLSRSNQLQMMNKIVVCHKPEGPGCPLGPDGPGGPAAPAEPGDPLGPVGPAGPIEPKKDKQVRVMYQQDAVESRTLSIN